MLIDFFVVFYLIPFSILGYRDGLLKKIVGMFTIIVAMILATKAMVVVGKLLSFGLLQNVRTQNFLGFFFVFLFLITVKFIVYRWFQKKKGTGEPKLLSRVIGVALGIFQGIFASSLMFVLLYFINMPPEAMKHDSALYRKFFFIAPGVFDFSTRLIPESKTFFDELQNQFGIAKLPD